MANTHIIIPINDIDEKIKSMYKGDFEEWNADAKNGYLTAVRVLSRFIQKQGKQITLDENYIDALISIKYPLKDNPKDSCKIQDFNTTQLIKRDAYKQALKDLSGQTL